MIIIKIYIDFDGTLFNSTKLYNDFIKFFKKYNIDELSINKLYKQEKNLDTLATSLIKKYSLPQSISEEFNQIYSNKLIYKDIIPFLEEYSKKYYLIYFIKKSRH